MDDVINSNWTQFLDLLVKLALLPLALFALHKLQKLLNFRLTEAQEKDLESSLEKGIRLAAEQALKAYQANGTIVPGPVKLALAKTKAREFSATGLVSIEEKALVDLIEAKVNALRPSMSSSIPPPSAADAGTQYHSIPPPKAPW